MIRSKANWNEKVVLVVIDKKKMKTLDLWGVVLRG